jgi:hypothetical protein
MELFGNVLCSLSDSDANFFIAGDFNIDVANFSTNSRVTDYIELLFSYGVLQTITKPTRCTHNSASIIDHVITNVRQPSYKSVILTSKISDHFPITFFVDSFKKNQKSSFITTRDFSKPKLESFKNTLESINWNFVEDAPDAQNAYNLFSDTFNNLYHLNFPLKTVKLKLNSHRLEPWMTLGLLISRCNKFKLSSAASKNPTHFNITIFKSYRNVYNTTIRASKKAYFDREFSKSRSNLKRTWDLIRAALKTEGQRKEFISDLTLNGINYNDPRQIAEKLNEFFVSAPQRVSEGPHPGVADTSANPSESIHDNPPDLPFAFSVSDSPVTRSEILEAVAQLEPKKSEDLYGLSMFFIKKFMSNLINPLYHIIYKSFEAGIFPSQLKIAKTVPIFKGGDKCNPDNYRPISLLPNFSKILEKVMCNRLTHYLESNEILCKEQFGFRKNHSTLHPIIYFLNQIALANNSNSYSIAIFCDLRKAFDTVNHEILLKKLERYGIKGLELEWFRDYLRDRKQFVSIDNVSSGLLNCILGVPQGSILGPLLFIFYINDLPSCNALKNSLFADDTLLFDSDKNLDNLVSKVNIEFQKVIEYFRINKLTLHPEKTKFMLFTSKKIIQLPNIVFNYNKPSCVIQQQNLIKPMTCVNAEPSAAIRFLGVMIDPQLSFKNHLLKLNRKLSTGLYFLRNVRNLLNPTALKFIYFALFHSHLIYAIQAWSCTSDNLLKPIILKQKQAIRILSNSKYNAHTEPLFKKLRILPFPKLCLFFKIQFMQQFTQKYLPTIFNNTWVSNSIRRAGQNHVELRNDDNLAIPFSRTITISRLPLFSFPRIWEEFPSEHIKFMRDKIEFNFNLKNYLLSELLEIPICERLFCPSCLNTAN